MLVTGGAGFIGSHLADYLLQRGYRVVIVDDLSGGFRSNIPAQSEFFQFSLTDTKEVRSLFRMYRFRYVYHCAAYAAEGLSHLVRHFNYSNNLLASTNLINASVNHDVECFVYASSMAVYGAGQVPFKEEDIPQPIDPYGIAKYAVECDLHAAAKMFGLNSIIFRPHNVYGERQNLSDPFRNVVGIFLRQILDRKPCTVFGNGKQARAFSYIGDIVPFIAGSVLRKEAHGEVFNIGSEQPYTILELANLVQRVIEVTVGIEYLPGRYEVVEAYCNHDKAKRILGYKDHTSLPVGLQRMADWARTITRARHRAQPENEIDKRPFAPWAKTSEPSNR